MYQILQSLRNGTTEVLEVPCPSLKPNHLLIRSHASLISSGTERSLIDFGKANLLNKARLQPEKLRLAFDKIKTDGIFPTLDAIRSKLAQPITLGYCNSGVVIGIGEGVEGFALGDRVISNGPHAQVVCVPKNLCAKIPSRGLALSDEEACFTVLGSIALQGIRLLNPTLGEKIVVQGLGVIGLITVQLLKANGCQVLAVDFNEDRLKLAGQFGAETLNLSLNENPLSAAALFSKGLGVDGVLITASTQSSDPVHQAATMCRKRGRIILVGVTGLQLNRSDFYEKELSFQVSCSYGPGRYDPNFELKGQDYPFAYVRWTETRNLEAVLELLADGSLNFSSLISKRFLITEAPRAYEELSQPSSTLGIVLLYPNADSPLGKNAEKTTLSLLKPATANPQIPNLGLIGAGNFTTSVLLPILQKLPVNLQSISSEKGASAAIAARKFKIESATTDTETLIRDPAINTLFITTQHDSHGSLVLAALNEGKNIFVEKPLSIKLNEIDAIQTKYQELQQRGKAPLVCIGFNRRFSPLSVKLKDLLVGIQEPKTLIMTINAGRLAPNSWQNDSDLGGGRIVGEACHFIDLFRFIVGYPIQSIEPFVLQSLKLHSGPQVTLNLRFSDGSMGTIHYLCNGHRSFAKERLEVFVGGRILAIDNFRRLKAYGWPRFNQKWLLRQDKGHRSCIESFLNAIKEGKTSPIPFNEIIEVSRFSLKAELELKSGKTIYASDL